MANEPKPKRGITTNDLLVTVGAGLVGVVFAMVDTYAQYRSASVHAVVTGGVVFTLALLFYRVGRNLER
jgi:predicted membrane channel-forming protein YqfA (hemolysin III family)